MRRWMQVLGDRTLPALRHDRQAARGAAWERGGLVVARLSLKVSCLLGALACVGAIAMVEAPSAAAACSNEAIRAEQASTYLSNCRAYEEVTPAQEDAGEPRAVKIGFDEPNPLEPIKGARAAVDGDRMAWASEYSLPGLAGASTPGLTYLSARGAEGWSTEATVPPQSPEIGLLCPILEGIVGWSDNLTRGVLSDGDAQETNGGKTGVFSQQGFACGHAEPALKEADGAEIKEPTGFQNLFLRDSEAATYQLVNVTPSGAPIPTPAASPISSRNGLGKQIYFPPNFLAGSDQLKHVAFEDELPLTKEAEKLTPEVEAACKEEPKGRACWEGHDDVYVWSDGRQPAVRLVTVLPNGKPVEGTLAGSTRNAFFAQPAEERINVADYRHAMSVDGSRIFFEAEGKLYVRENAYAEQSTAGECTEAEREAEPQKACTLQLDASQGGSGSGGGEWLGASQDGARVFFTDEQDLTPTATAALGKPDLYEYDFEAKQGARLKDLTVDAAEPAYVQGISGLSEDGSYVYFVAEGQLVAGKGTAGQPNLYVSHDGAIAYIATLSATDICDWTSNTGCNIIEPSHPLNTGLTARVAGNGRYLAFNSVNALTGYDNVGPQCVPVYKGGVFHGEYRSGPCEEIFLYEAEAKNLVCVSCNSTGAPSDGGAVIAWPATLDRNAEMKNSYPQRNLSETGQVFFDTSEALLPQRDTNGLPDVYEYEHGALRLISSGTSSAASYFLDATPSGSDVFFATAQKLVRRDTESTYEIYDARVDGGFPEPPAPPLPCESEGCKGAASGSAVFAMPGSITFSGGGNATHAGKQHKTKFRPNAKRKRNVRLRGALRRCVRRYRHEEQKRRRCERHVRRVFSRKAKAKRHHGGAK